MVATCVVAAVGARARLLPSGGGAARVRVFCSVVATSRTRGRNASAAEDPRAANGRQREVQAISPLARRILPSLLAEQQPWCIS